MARLPYFSHEPPQTWQDANRIAAVKMSMEGFPVFPLYSSGVDTKGRQLVKRPIGQWRHWQPRPWQEIDQLWRGNWAEYLPGIGLEALDLVVFDPDVRPEYDMQEVWDQLCAENGLPPDVPICWTPGGGTHNYFRQHPDIKLGNSPGNLPPHIDVRGAGGLVVAPGAMLPDGRQWSYHEGTIFRVAPQIPDWLLIMASGTAPAPISLDPAHEEAVNNVLQYSVSQGQGNAANYYTQVFGDELRKLRQTQKGGRNNQLNNSAFKIGKHVPSGGIDRSDAIRALVEVAHEIGLVRDDGMHQVMQTIMSGISAGERSPANPRIKMDLPRLEAPYALRAAETLPGPTAAPQEETPAGEPEGQPEPITEGEIAQALRFMFRGEFPEEPRIPIIKNALPRRGTGFMSGPSRAGKTFLAIDLAVSVASGQDVWGTWPIREPVGVAYISGEGSGKIEDRFEAAERARGLTNPLPIMICKKPGNLLDQANGNSLFQDLLTLNETMFQRWGVRVGLVIIDTLSACFHMKNENDAPEAAYVCRLMEAIGDLTDGFVLTLHHSAKDAITGGRGSGAFFANVDQWFNVVTLRNELDQIQGRNLYLAKNKEGEELSLGEFHIDSLEIRKDMDGDPVAPGIVVMGKQDGNQESAQVKHNNGVGMRTFRQAFEDCMRTASFPHLASEAVTVQAVLVGSVIDRFIALYTRGKTVSPDNLRNRHRAALKAWTGGRGVTLDGQQILWR